MPIPATLGVRAQEAFRRILAGLSAEPFPRLLRIEEERSFLRQDMTFRALFDPAPPGGDWRWRVTLSEMRQAGCERDLGMWYPPYREIWEDCCAERRRELGIEIRPVEPPRLTVPEGALAAIDWGRDGEALFGGPAGGGMVSNQAAEAPPPLTMERMREAFLMIEQAQQARVADHRARLEAEYRAEYRRIREYMQAMPGPADRADAGCPCSICRRRRQEAGLSDAEYEAALVGARLEAANARREADAAESRSVALLKEWLSPAQLAQYERERCFEVTGSAGTRYQISPFKSGNVYEVADGRVIRSWCFGPEGEAGRWIGDVMLAQKLALETDEEGVLAVANRVSGPPREGERAIHTAPAAQAWGMAQPLIAPQDLF